MSRHYDNILLTFRSLIKVQFTNNHYTNIRSFQTNAIKLKKQDSLPDLPSKLIKIKRDGPGKNSLRRVSIEAERSRLVINKSGRQLIDPKIPKNTVTAYCAAEQYNIKTASRLLQLAGFGLDPYHTQLFPQVIHIRHDDYQNQNNNQNNNHSNHTNQTSINNNINNNNNSNNNNNNKGDVFVFPSGTLVGWNVPNELMSHIIEKILTKAAINPHTETVAIEEENMEYVEDSATDRSKIIGDTIVVGTKEFPEVNTILAKVAFSSGLARSTKLAVLERLTDEYFESTRCIPLLLSKGTPLPINRPRFIAHFFDLVGFGSRLPFSRSFILRKTGELLSIRAQLNLYSELTDSLPDLFWDVRHELGLEGYYEIVGRALDVGIRIKVLNEKMDYAQEIASVLREALSERHSLRLEWGIILLIFIEVVHGFIKTT